MRLAGRIASLTTIMIEAERQRRDHRVCVRIDGTGSSASTNQTINATATTPGTMDSQKTKR